MGIPLADTYWCAEHKGISHYRNQCDQAEDAYYADDNDNTCLLYGLQLAPGLPTYP